MTAVESLREGKLEEALSHLQQEVRRSPADPKLRVFLFQLMAVLGQWERAMIQLNVSGELDAGTSAMVRTYREALNCEALRQEVFAGRKAPLIFGRPEQWMALLVEGLKCGAAGEWAQVARLRDEAFDLAPATSGNVDGQPFEWIADADGRLGPMLEAIFNGRYYWVPFKRIRAIRVEPPADLRDAVWMPAFLTWANGGEVAALLPTRYPGSQQSEDAMIRLSRKTDWLERAEGVHHGIGQRLIATDSQELALMDLRLIELNVSAEEEAEPAHG